MKLKGINPFEQHAEKLVLGLVSVVFLAVLAMQFLLQPNAIEDGGDTLAPGNIYKNIRGEADRLTSEMNEGRPSLPEFGETPDLAEAFREMVSSAAPAEPLEIAMGRSFDMEVSEAPVDPTKPIGPVEVPAPTALMAASFIGTVDPYALSEFEGLDRYVDEQPYDLRSVTVEATFDGEALQAALRGDGLSSDFRAMSLSWWREGLEIIKIETERERLDPVSGDWGEPQPVRTAPGSLDLVGEHSAGWLSSQPDADELADLVDDAGARASELLEPVYYPLIAGPSWEPPADRGSVRAAVERADRLFDLSRRIVQLEERRETVAAGPRERVQTPRGVDNPRQGRNNRDSDTNQAAQEAAEARRAAEIDSLNEQIEGLVEEFESLEPTPIEAEELEILRGNQPDAGPRSRAPRPPRPGTTRTGAGFIDTELGGGNLTDSRFNRRSPRDAGRRGGSGRREALLFNDSVRLWVHDLEVDPGAIYRYRTRVVINNPMYDRQQQLRDQPELGEDPFIEGAWSDWSNPVRVDPDLYFFVSAASERGQLSTEPLATVEMFRYWYGYWRRGDSNFNPGMPLEVTPENARLAMPIVDVDEVEEPDLFYSHTVELDAFRVAMDAWRDAQNAPVEREDSPSGRPSIDDPGSDIGRSIRTVRTQQDPGEEPEAPEELEGVTTVEVGRLFSDLYLLDVVALPFMQPAPNSEVEQLLSGGDDLLGERAFARAVAEAEREGQDPPEAPDEDEAVVEDERLDRWEVVFIGSDGEFIRRSTNADRNSVDYRRLQLSARRGERQTLQLGPQEP